MMTKIFIDPGHGGSDPGAVGNGLREKDLTLAISLKIRDILNAEYTGHTIRLSRTNDTTLSLKQRTDMANAWGADFLLSVHINAGGGTGYEDFIYNKLSDTSGTAKLRDVIHAEIIKEIPDARNRGKKKANFHMLRESRMSSMLTENLFIDNKTDADKLKSDAYLSKIARGHAVGIAKAFGLKKKSTAPTKEVASKDIHKVSDWAKKSWKKAQAKKAKDGTPIMDGTRPGAPITREQVAVILDRLGLLD